VRPSPPRGEGTRPWKNFLRKAGVFEHKPANFVKMEGEKLAKMEPLVEHFQKGLCS
jgi:hypothetical protein